MKENLTKKKNDKPPVDGELKASERRTVKSRRKTSETLPATPSTESSFDAPAESDWHRTISETAYYLAAKRNFIGGDPLQDWLDAEEIVKKSL